MLSTPNCTKNNLKSCHNMQWDGNILSMQPLQVSGNNCDEFFCMGERKWITNRTHYITGDSTRPPHIDFGLFRMYNSH